MSSEPVTLYAMQGTCATAVHIALAWSDIAHEAVILPRGQQRSVEYLAINPLGAVPAIRLGEDDPITEATAILAYIDALTPGFAPGGTEPLRSLRLGELLSFLNSENQAAFAPHFAPQRFLPDSAQHAPLREAAYARIERLIHLLDARIEGPYYFGDLRSVADPYIFVITRWLAGTPIALEKFPPLARLQQTMLADEAVQAVLAQYQ